MKAVLSYLSGFTAKFWLAVVAVLIAALPLSYCKGRSDGYSAHERKVAADALRAADKAAVSAGEAAGERETDLTTIDQEKERRDDAIEQAGDESPATANIALSCQRLRQAGTDVSLLPACRGREGGS